VIGRRERKVQSGNREKEKEYRIRWNKQIQKEKLKRREGGDTK